MLKSIHVQLTLVKKVMFPVSTACNSQSLRLLIRKIGDLETAPPCVSYQEVGRSFLTWTEAQYIQLTWTAENLFIEAAVILQL